MRRGSTGPTACSWPRQYSKKSVPERVWSRSGADIRPLDRFNSPLEALEFAWQLFQLPLPHLLGHIVELEHREHVLRVRAVGDDPRGGKALDTRRGLHWPHMKIDRASIRVGLVADADFPGGARDSPLVILR